MNPGDLGLLLQGIGALLLLLVTLLVGLRAAKALSIRIEGPVALHQVAKTLDDDPSEGP
jgi:hypothetical protein